MNLSRAAFVMRIEQSVAFLRATAAFGNIILTANSPDRLAIGSISLKALPELLR
jgi:hypothetical protein